MSSFAHREPPKICDACNSSNITYSTELILLGRKSKRTWQYIWFCKDCKALVGTHIGTDWPLGYMANDYVRKLRADLHDWIDPLWKHGLGTRSEIYAWLASEIAVPVEFFHIAQLSISQLKILIAVGAKYHTMYSREIKEAMHDRRYKEKGNRSKRGKSNRKR